MQILHEMGSFIVLRAVILIHVSETAVPSTHLVNKLISVVSSSKYHTPASCIPLICRPLRLRRGTDRWPPSSAGDLSAV